MTPKRLLYLIFFAIIGSYAFVVAKTHTSGEVIAYKNFAKALQANNPVGARAVLAAGQTQPMLAFNYSAERNERFFLGTDRVFTYYRILSRGRLADGNRAFVRAEQVTRVNRPGNNRIYGAERVSIIHNVELVQERSAWRVYRFYDPVMQP